MKLYCLHCQSELSEVEKDYNWSFRYFNKKIWFCSHSCVTSWNCEQILRQKEKRRN